MTPYKVAGGGEPQASAALVIDPSVLPTYAAYLKRFGAATAFVNGTTGEFVHLQPEEREELAAAWVAAARPCGLQVVVHVGDDDEDVMERLAAHAGEIAADGIAVMAPPSHGSSYDVRRVAELLRRVSIASRGLPVYYYHFEDMNKCRIDVIDLVRSIAVTENGLDLDCPSDLVIVPSFRGIKFTDRRLSIVNALCAERVAIVGHSSPTTAALHMDLDVACGSDDTQLPAMLFGCSSVSGSFTAIAPIYQRLRSAVAAGRIAEGARWQTRAGVFITHALARCGLPPLGVLRTVARDVMGVPLGPSRSPGTHLTKADEAHLTALLAECAIDSDLTTDVM